MGVEEQIERIRDLVDILSNEANEHAHLREIVEDEASRTYHLGYTEALRTTITRILDILRNGGDKEWEKWW